MRLRYLLLLFIFIPIVELAILIQLGEWIGTLPTICIVIATGIWGALLTKNQGIAVWAKIRQDFRAGNIPHDELINGLFVLVGGAFLLTPGILTDCLGFSFLIPVTRNSIKEMIKRHLKKRKHFVDVEFNSQ